MSEESPRALFAYGTLVRGNRPAMELLRDAMVAVSGAVAEGILLHVPAPFPAARFGAGRGTVRGKLLWLDPERAEETLARVDECEGVPWLFERVKVTVRVGDGSIEAEAYEWVGPRTGSASPYPGRPMDREGLTREEEAAWAAFRRELERIPPDERERPGVGPDGWTVKDLLWHVAYWWDDLTDTLGRLLAGTFEEPADDDEETDAENARVLEASRRMRLDDIKGGAAEARARMLAAWAALPQVDAVATKHFRWETIEHYEEHEPDLRRFAEELGLP